MDKNYISKIKGIRAEHNATQEKCAEIIGVSAQTYRSKEKGDIDFKLSEVIDLLNYFGEDITRIV